MLFTQLGKIAPPLRMTQAWPLEHVRDVKLLLHMTAQDVPVWTLQLPLAHVASVRPVFGQSSYKHVSDVLPHDVALVGDDWGHAADEPPVPSMPPVAIVPPALDPPVAMVPPFVELLPPVPKIPPRDVEPALVLPPTSELPPPVGSPLQAPSATNTHKETNENLGTILIANSPSVKRTCRLRYCRSESSRSYRHCCRSSLAGRRMLDCCRTN